MRGSGLPRPDIFTSYGKLPVTLFNSASTRGRWANRDEIAAFLTGCSIFLKKNRPDLVWTYGGDPVSRLLHEVVRRYAFPCSLNCTTSRIAIRRSSPPWIA